MSEALRLADLVEHDPLAYSDDAAAELRRLSAELAALKAAYAIAAIEAQASVVQQEPVAWMWKNIKTDAEGVYLEDPATIGIELNHPAYQWTPIYTHPAQQAKPQPLSDEQIEIFAIRAMNACGCKTMKTVVPFGTEVIPMAKHMAYAIESAACADRDARIAELEQRNRDLHEDVKRFRNHALNEKDARMALERELAEARKDAERWNMVVEVGQDVLRHPNNRKIPLSVSAYMNAIHKGFDLTCAIDTAIDAAMKGTQ